jgi:adenylate cyclase
MFAVRWLVQSGLRVTVLIAILVGAYHVLNELRVMNGRPLNFHQRLELTALDVKFAFRGSRAPAEWRVAIAAVDEKAIDAYGPLPWSRTVHADLVDRLTALGAGSIAFDMTFEQAGSVPEKKAAEKLRREAESVGLFRGKAALDAIRGSQEIREVAAAIEAFEMKLSDMTSAVDPDEAFAKALERSERVVLGVVALSKTEAESLSLSSDRLDRSLAQIGSSTISELVSIGDGGLSQISPGDRMFREGIFRRYFGVHAPVEALARATPHFGLINASPDDDGVNRRLPLVSAIKDRGVLVPSLALKAVEVASGELIEVLGTEDDLSPHGLRIGELAVRTELQATTTIDWYGRFDSKDMPILSIADVLEGKVAREQVDGRVIFVAATAVGTHDQRVTPLERAVPGVYIHATLAQNILENRHMTRPLYVIALELSLILIIGAIAGFVMTRFDVAGQLVAGALMVAAWLAADQLILFGKGLVVYTVLPVFQIFVTALSVALWRFFVEQRERRKTKQAFGRYLSPHVMEQVLSDPEEYLKLGGRRYEATVLFSDIRGFTTISEALSPEELGRMLNLYMTPMTDIVFEFQGTLDKYIGDAVMAFWGAPLEQKEHALLGCRASLRMIEEVARLNTVFEKEGLPSIAIGIGLSSGPMTIGNMGSDEHFAYTALGDRVNLGARLEGQTKDYGVDIILSDACHALVKDRMRCRELGSIRVKGKFEPVRIYELLGEGAAGEGEQAFVDAFHRGLSLYRAQRWDEALAAFDEAQALAGDDGDKTTELYVAWCHEYQEEPPPPGWDGVRVATSK